MIKLALIVLLALPAAAKPRKPLPGADELILKALAGPATSYTAVERVQVFVAEKKPKAIKTNLAVLPGGKVRREVLPTKKKASSIVLVRGGTGEAPERGLARLKDIYDLTVSTGGVVAKRKTWRVDLRLKKGILRRTLWLDRDSGLMLKRETYRDDGALSRRERIVKLDLPAHVDATAFAGISARGPWMPDGFAFIGEKDGRRRYSNGLQSYEVWKLNGKVVVSGDLAEDDASRVLESAEL